MTTPNPLIGWQLDRADVRSVGRDLQRPECILAERDGTLWSADARGGVMRINPDGSQQLIAQKVDTRFGAAPASSERYMLQGTLPNGLAFADNGDFLIANFGTDALERMTRGGESRVLYTQIDGAPLGKVGSGQVALFWMRHECSVVDPQQFGVIGGAGVGADTHAVGRRGLVDVAQRAAHLHEFPNGYQTQRRRGRLRRFTCPVRPKTVNPMGSG